MPNESVQKKLSRVGKPRVHITYDVQVGEAMVKRELPFVVGVLSDLSGDRDPQRPLPKVQERKFVQVEPSNFDEVMGKIKPRLELMVKNTLDNDATNIGAILTFEKLSDFNPENLVKNIPSLNALLEKRSQLSNLRSSLYGNDRLEELLREVLDKTEKERHESKSATVEKKEGDD